MVASEREMIRNLRNEDEVVPERTTSLQPTYEDSVAPEIEEDWDDVEH